MPDEPVVPLAAVLHADRVTLEVLEAEAAAVLECLMTTMSWGGSWGISVKERDLLKRVRDRLLQAVEAKKK